MLMVVCLLNGPRIGMLLRWVVAVVVADFSRLRDTDSHRGYIRDRIGHVQMPTPTIDDDDH